MNSNIRIPLMKRISEIASGIGAWIRKMSGIAWLRISLITLLYVTGSILFLALLVFYLIPGVQHLSPLLAPSQLSQKHEREGAFIDQHITPLEKEVEKLEKKLDKQNPKGPYIVINTTRNMFFLYKKKGELLRQGFCSTGSYIQLISHNNKQWVFKTPKGVLKVHGKKTSPVWIKPDWAFIEEGMPVPSPNHPSRYERGVLGDYAISLGRGYMIHGTLYQRMLGMPVTHGCIRMSDADIEAAFKTLKPGSKVFIY